jgi:hypothetical protein
MHLAQHLTARNCRVSLMPARVPEHRKVRPPDLLAGFGRCSPAVVPARISPVFFKLPDRSFHAGRHGMRSECRASFSGTLSIQCSARRSFNADICERCLDANQHYDGEGHGAW